MMNKPIVLYRYFFEHPAANLALGKSTVVWPLDHPSPLVSNTKPVWTSPVIRLGPRGEFETENTIYRPNVVMNHDA